MYTSPAWFSSLGISLPPLSARPLCVDGGPGAGRGAAGLSRLADARRAAARYGQAQRLIVFVSGAGPLPHPTVQHNDLGGGEGEWAGAAPGFSEAESLSNIKLQRRAQIAARKRREILEEARMASRVDVEDVVRAQDQAGAVVREIGRAPSELQSLMLISY